jgi:hypothetical protein
MLRFVLAVVAVASCTLGAQEEKGQQEAPPASQPASRPAERESPRDPIQAQIYEELLRNAERPRAKPILSVEPGREGQEAEAAGGPAASLLLEGTVLIERAGRLVRTGDRLAFHFKAGALAEGATDTMEVLKNGLLEAMEAEAEAGVKEFVISAEVTRYRGQNFLLLRKYRRQTPHGNLGP